MFFLLFILWIIIFERMFVRLVLSEMHTCCCCVISLMSCFGVNNPSIYFVIRKVLSSNWLSTTVPLLTSGTLQNRKHYNTQSFLHIWKRQRRACTATLSVTLAHTLKHAPNWKHSSNRVFSPQPGCCDRILKPLKIISAMQHEWLMSQSERSVAHHLHALNICWGSVSSSNNWRDEFSCVCENRSHKVSNQKAASGINLKWVTLAGEWLGVEKWRE